MSGQIFLDFMSIAFPVNNSRRTLDFSHLLEEIDAQSADEFMQT